MNGYKSIKVEWIGKVKKIVFNRPDKLNSFNRVLMNEVIEEVLKRDGAKAIVFTGEGRFFSAGIDLGEVASAKDEEDVQDIFRTLARMFNTILGLDIPVIILLNGDAYGGGAEFIWLGDFVIAPRNIKIGWAEARWGLVPPIFPALAPLSIGIMRSQLISYTSGTLTSEEAYQYGLISHIVDEPSKLEEGFKKILEDLENLSLESFKSLKNSFRMWKNSYLINFGVSELIRLSRNSEVSENARKFILEKRFPRYSWGFY